MAPHRVLFVEVSMGGVLGGSLTGILPLIERLDRTRFSPALALFEAKGIEADMAARGVPVHVLGGLPRPLAGGQRSRLGRAGVRAADLWQVVRPRAQALAALYRRERPDVVYLANGLTSALAGVVAGARCRVPVICHEKGFRRVGPVERFMSRWVDTCICMTGDIVAHYRHRRVRARRFLTIFDGIDPDAYEAGGGAAIRRELGIPSEAPLVGIVGHIQGWKGQHVVVEAVALARAAVPDLHCLVVGGVHRHGREYAARLPGQIAAHGLEGRVILTGARRDVPACMDAMDIVLHSSVTPEPFGRVVLEAMALGRPVIAPREGGPLLMVRDGETGTLVAPRDPGALADAIVELVRDPARRAAMGRAGRARVREVFDIRHHTHAIEALLDDVLGVRPMPARATAACGMKCRPMAILEPAGPNAEQIRYWNETAGPKWIAFQRLLDAQLGPLGRRTMDGARIAAGDRVLDVGCGCGDTTLELARRVGPEGLVVGVDVSAGMVARAAETAREAGLANVRFENADAQTHRFPHPEFDVVYSRFGVMFFADAAAAFTNLRSALRPGGRLAFLCWQALRENPWLAVPLEAAARHLTLPPPPAPDAPGPFSFADPERVRSILTRAGFDQVVIEDVRETLALGGGATVDDAVEFLLQGVGPTSAALRAADPAVRPAVAAAVRAALAPFDTPAGVRMASAAWIVTGSSVAP